MTVTVSPVQLDMLDLLNMPGETFTPAQASAYHQLRDRFRAEAFNDAQTILQNHMHWFEKEPHAKAGFMHTYAALENYAKEGSP